MTGWLVAGALVVVAVLAWVLTAADAQASGGSAVRDEDERRSWGPVTR